MIDAIRATDRRAPEVPAPAWARVTPAGSGLWRVTDLTGRVLGHIRARHVERGWRYAAERFSAAAGGFRPLGEFWVAAEALDCVRYQR